MYFCKANECLLEMSLGLKEPMPWCGTSGKERWPRGKKLEKRAKGETIFPRTDQKGRLIIWTNSPNIAI